MEPSLDSKKGTVQIAALVIPALSILCLSVITISSICSSHVTADESNNSSSQYTNFDTINDIEPETDKSKNMAHGFNIDNNVSGESTAVIITTELSLIHI